MTQLAIQVDNIGKQYQLGLRQKANQTLREAIVELAKAPLKRLRHLSGRSDDEGTFWALRHVNFNVAHGEALGIIGHNGAGKSTLLKVLSRITEPTEGRAVMRGRVASLLEVGTGFHPELSGRENVYLNGAILGMSQVEIKNKFDEIVAFSGVEKFLDTPIKRYSSGMKVRLAFAVAAHLEPEVLIIDEVLAVGDAEFRRKCMGKMDEVAQAGRTVLFVSHNMAAVENLCDRAIVLSAGQVQFEGDASQAVGFYHSQHQDEDRVASDMLRSIPRPEGLRRVINGIEMRRDGDHEPTAIIPAGTALTIEIHYDSDEPLVDAGFGLTFETQLGDSVFCIHTRQQAGISDNIPSSGTIRCHVPRLPLLPGNYFITPHCGARQRVIDRIPRSVQLTVADHDVFGTGFIPATRHGAVFTDASWELGSVSSDNGEALRGAASA